MFLVLSPPTPSHTPPVTPGRRDGCPWCLQGPQEGEGGVRVAQARVGADQGLGVGGTKSDLRGCACGNDLRNHLSVERRVETIRVWDDVFKNGAVHFLGACQCKVAQSLPLLGK